MLRPVLAFSALSLLAAPAAAATYSAKPAIAAPATIAAKDIVWTCSTSACVGQTKNSRPLVLCQALAKQAGRIDSFLVDGREIPGADLERCNAFAKTDAGKAVANAR